MKNALKLGVLIAITIAANSYGTEKQKTIAVPAPGPIATAPMPRTIPMIIPDKSKPVTLVITNRAHDARKVTPPDKKLSIGKDGEQCPEKCPSKATVKGRWCNKRCTQEQSPYVVEPGQSLGLHVNLSAIRIEEPNNIILEAEGGNNRSVVESTNGERIIQVFAKGVKIREFSGSRYPFNSTSSGLCSVSSITWYPKGVYRIDLNTDDCVKRATE